MRMLPLSALLVVGVTAAATSAMSARLEVELPQAAVSTNALLAPEPVQLEGGKANMPAPPPPPIPAVVVDAPSGAESGASPNTAKLSEGISQPDNTVPTLYGFPVDFVYTWVNGSDLQWRKDRERYSTDIGEQVASDSNTEFRFREYNELKFSLRSVNDNAAWVRNIYVVTCCKQQPDWLKDSPRVKVIGHTEIMPENESPNPTYNSFAIETWVHKIPGLAEQFVLMNDDFYIGAPIEKRDLYDEQGRPRIAFQEDWGVNTKPPPTKDDAYLWAAHNCDQLLDKDYHSEPRYKVLHQAYPMTKRLYKRAHEVYGPQLAETTSHRFRTREDVIPHFLAAWIGIYEKGAVRLGPADYPSNFYLRLEDDADNRQKLLDLLGKSGQYKFFCIGDHVSHGSRELHDTMQEFQTAYFPNKAAWER